jgi:hypothetical protein
MSIPSNLLVNSLLPTAVLLALACARPLDSAYALSNREAAEFEQFTPTDRMIQVCSLKLENRISKDTRYRHVDRVVLDAFSRAKIADRTVRAGGAAFRNEGNWFKLRFNCAVTQDRMHVESLDYDVASAKAIPRKDWEEHRLFP